MNRYYVCFLIGFLMPLVATAQEPQIILDQPIPGNESHNFLARDSIKMTGDFEYDPQTGKNVTCRIDPLLLFPPETGIYGGPNPGDDGVVGAIDGEFAVTPTGAAVYSIPVELPPGTGGMKPELALVYNSQSKDGIMGYGWSISGISSISHAPLSYYYNGHPGQIDFEVTMDERQLILDGKKLIITSYYENGPYPITYRCEEDNISRIRYYPSGNYFIEEAKSGIIREYGRTLNSRQYLGNNLISWNLNKIIDRFGNYIAYSYKKNPVTGELWIDKITYTGNASQGLNPYITVSFTYKERNPLSQPTVHFRGQDNDDAHFTITKLLEKIEVYYQTGLVGTYDIDYTEGGIFNDSIFIHSIGRKAVNQHYNPTTFTWKFNSPENQISQSFQYTTSNISPAPYPSLVCAAEMNGDGCSDIIEGVCNNQNKLRLRISDKNGTLEDVLEFVTSAPLSSNTIIKSADLDGDGTSEILLMGSRMDIIDISYDPVNQSFSYTEYCDVFDWHDKITFGDFNGDGLDDIIIIEESVDFACYLYTGREDLNLFVNSGWLDDFTLQGNSISTGDFDGDGKTELFLKKTVNSADILSLDETNTNMIVKYTFEHVDEWLYFLTGDFNDDNKTDLFVPIPDQTNPGSYIPRLYYSFGQGFVNTPVSGITWDNNYTHLVADLNGDGRSDIFRYRVAYTQQLKVYCGKYLMGADGKNLIPQYIPIQEHTYNDNFRDLIMADFSGNGKTDIMYEICYFDDEPESTEPAIYQGYMLYDTINAIHAIESVTNGMGKKTSVVYNSMCRYEGYSTSSTSLYPVSGFTAPLYLVSKLFQDNGKGSFFPPVEYYYGGARTHRLGKGFLGFEEFTYIDKKNDVATRSHYSFYTAPNQGGQPEILYFYPYIDTVEQILQDANGEYDKIVSLTVNEVNHISTVPFEPLVYFPYVRESLTKRYEINATNDLVSVTKKEEFNHDQFGNPKKIKMSKGAHESQLSYVELATHTYWNNEATWILGRMTGVVVEKTVPQTEKAIRSSSFSYYADTTLDNYGMLRSEIMEPNDTNSLKNTYEYDGFGNILISLSVPADTGSVWAARKTITQYDTATGRFVEQSINPLNHIDTYSCDPVWGKTIALTDANGLTTSCDYDEFARLQGVEYPDGNREASVYRWVEGNDPDTPPDAVYMNWKKGSGKPEIVTYYDILGRELRKVTTGFQNSTVYIDSQYDTVTGRLSAFSDPYFKGETAWYSTFQYDPLNRMISRTLPGNRVYNYTYNGLETTVTNPAGQSETTVINPAGWEVEIHDNENQVVKYEYNSQGLPERSWIEGFQQETEIIMDYDVMGNLIEQVDPDMGNVSYRYNPFGELIHKEHNGSEEFTSVQYDLLGRLTGAEEPGFGSYVYVYDHQIKGNPDTVLFSGTNGSEVTKSWIYDDLGRVAYRDQKVHAGITNEHFSVSTGYDVFGRIRDITYPSGFAVVQKYDAAGFLKTIQRSTDEKSVFEVKEMNARLQVEKALYGNGLLSCRDYYQATGYLKSIVTGDALETSGQLVQSFGYGWNSVGNLIWREKNPGGQNLREDFIYDGLNRLTDVNLNNGQVLTHIGYDPLGRIVSKTSSDPLYHVASNFYYEDPSNPFAVTRIDHQPVTISAEGQTIDYTPFDKVKQITQGNKTLQIIYDHAHNKLVQDFSGTDTSIRKIYFGDLYEKVFENGKVREVHYIRSGEGLVAVYTRDSLTGDTFRYVHTDHLGSIQCLTNENGDMVSEFSYDAWGSRRDPDTWMLYSQYPQQIMDRGFTGHMHLDAFSLVDMSGRMYDPVLGCFLSPDPARGLPSHTQEFNPYAYCMNNPLSLVDPSGYSWLSDAWKSLGGTLIGITVSVLTMGTLTPVVAGILGGFTGGFAGSLINGGDFNDAFQAGFIGGVIGGVTAGFAHGIGETFVNTESLFAQVAKIVTHGAVGGYLTVAQGGKFKHGFMAGIAGSVAGMVSSGLSHSVDFFSKPAGTAFLAGALGGTVSVLGGGKFANGAITASYTALFNHWWHRLNKMVSEKIKFDRIREKFTEEGYSYLKHENVEKFLKKFYNDPLRLIDKLPLSYKLGNKVPFIGILKKVIRSVVTIGDTYAEKMWKSYEESGAQMGLYYRMEMTFSADQVINVVHMYYANSGKRLGLIPF